jgi:hypothetical protein
MLKDDILGSGLVLCVEGCCDYDIFVVCYQKKLQPVLEPET